MTKSKRNTCQSLAKRHQFMMYLYYSKEYILDHKSIHISDSKETFCEALDCFDKKAVDEQLNLKTYDLVTHGSGVLFEKQRYSVGDVVLLSFPDGEYQFGLVKSVLANTEQTCLVYARLIIECFVSHLNCYKVQEADIVSLHLINHLLDYYPLELYKISQAKFISLKHYISVSE